MSMDDPASSHELRDTDMSEAAADDPDLALGESLYPVTLLLVHAYLFSCQSWSWHGT